MARVRDRSAGFIARRRLLGATVLPLGLASAADAHAAAGPLAATPRQTRGPFYPPDPPADAGNDLVIERDGRRAQGELTLLSGRVVDTAGRPLAGTRVEIWQCNAGGRYHHPRDDGPAPVDPLFRAFGRNVVQADGSWSFRTIRPVAYPGRTPHIHFQVTAPSGVQLVTQLYVRGEPANERDGVLARLSPADRDRLAAAFERRADGVWNARFELVIAA
jgi:protocatechuate 3,4-dioxygenase beta subunit